FHELRLHGTSADSSGSPSDEDLSIILGLDDSAPAGDTGGPRSINALAHAIAEIHRYDGVTADFRGARGLESRTRVFRDPGLPITLPSMPEPRRAPRRRPN